MSIDQKSKSNNIRLVDLTPEKLKCSYGACPGVYKTEENQIVIVGKQASGEILRILQEKISDDEWAIVIQSELLENISKY